jgi:hypothetical protein
MNLGGLLKAFNTMMALRDVARRMKDGPPRPSAADPGLVQAPSGGGIAGQIEARLTNVVMAALKEAFDRDHARLELERAQMEEQRRRAEEARRQAEEAMRQELRRQAADRELARLRVLSATALVGWIASVSIFVARMSSVTVPGKILMAVGWLFLLATLAVVLSAQGKVGEDIVKGQDVATAARPGSMAVWLLTLGLALAAISLMF